MLCQICKKNEANCYYKTNENGHITEKHLCSECAKKSGADLGFSLPFFSQGLYENGLFGNLLGSVLEKTPEKAQDSICSFCGMRLSEIFSGGKLGCANCYKEFKGALSKSMKKLHGDCVHTGKAPYESEGAKKEKEIDRLRSEMEKAVLSQEYERAAELRDKIKAMENGEEKQ